MNDPYTTARIGSADRRKRIGEQFYDMSHGLPYKLAAGALYAASPFTGGMTAIPATVMTAGSLGSSVDDMSRNGLTLGNGVNAAFDVLDLGTGLASSARQAAAHTARSVIPDLHAASIKANVAEAAAREGVDAAKRGVVRAQWNTAKAAAKRDAAAFYGPNSPAYRKASQKLAQAREIYRESPVTEYISRVPTPGGAVLNQSVKRGAAGTAVRNVGKKLQSYGYAQGAAINANRALRNATDVVRNGVEWRPISYSNLLTPFAQYGGQVLAGEE